MLTTWFSGSNGRNRRRSLAFWAGSPLERSLSLPDCIDCIIDMRFEDAFELAFVLHVSFSLFKFTRPFYYIQGHIATRPVYVYFTSFVPLSGKHKEQDVINTMHYYYSYFFPIYQFTPALSNDPHSRTAHIYCGGASHVSAANT